MPMVGSVEAFASASLLGAFRLVDGLHGGPEVRPCLEGDGAELREGRDCFRKVKGSRHVELLDGRPVVQEREELDLRRAQVHRGSLHVRFILDALQLQAVQVDAGDVPCPEALAAHIEDVVVVGEVLSRKGQDRLLLEHLYEGAPQGEEERPLLVGKLGDGDCRPLLRGLQPQAPLVHPLDQVAHRDRRLRVIEGAVRLEGVDVIR